MTNLDIVCEAIDELERKEINYAVAAKLADLYIVRDHMKGLTVEVKGIEAPEEEPMSEFMEAVKKAGWEKGWKVMDELMTTLQAVNRRLYDGVMRQLTEG